MHLLKPENIVLINNLTTAELVRYASLEFPDDPVISSLAEDAACSAQLEMELDEVRDSLNESQEKLGLRSDELLDSKQECDDYKSAVTDYLATVSHETIEASEPLQSLRDMVA